MSVPCSYPVKDHDSDEPPEGSEWRASETCDHDFCVEVAGWQRQWAGERAHRESLALARSDLDLPHEPERDVMEASLWRLK